MKKGLLVIGFIILSISPAQASECPSGAHCIVEVNCTTGETTLRVLSNTFNSTPQLQPIVEKPTVEQIRENVNQMVAAVTAPIEINPCIDGSCVKVELNASTNVMTTTPLTAVEIKQRTEEQAQNRIKEAELVKVAYKALPSVEPIEEVTKEEEPIEVTPLVEEEPIWWLDFLKQLGIFSYWFYSFNWYGL
jgi:hypothetical protein